MTGGQRRVAAAKEHLEVATDILQSCKRYRHQAIEPFASPGVCDLPNREALRATKGARFFVLLQDKATYARRHAGGAHQDEAVNAFQNMKFNLSQAGLPLDLRARQGPSVRPASSGAAWRGVKHPRKPHPHVAGDPDDPIQN
jgi:hypothetical protein